MTAIVIIVFLAFVPVESFVSTNFVQRGLEVDPPHSYPYVIFLKIDNGRSRCTASLITDSIVLTAFHCLAEGYPITVIAGGHDISVDEPTQQKQDVTAVNYQAIGDPNVLDIGIIRMPVPFVINEYVKTIKLQQTFNSNAGDPFDIAGWGAIRFNFYPDQMYAATVNYFINEEKHCRHVSENFPHICLFNLLKNQGACSGDSGAPLIKAGATPDEDLQIGVIINGPDECYLLAEAYVDSIVTESFCNILHGHGIHVCV